MSSHGRIEVTPSLDCGAWPVGAMWTSRRVFSSWFLHLAWTLLFLETTFTKTQAQAQVDTVVIVSVDGLGSHLLSMVDTPRIDTLVARGARAQNAQTVLPPKTIAGHTSMLTGVDPSRHGRTHNDLDEKLEKISVPTIFDLVKAKGGRTAAIVGKSKLKFLIDDGTVDVIHIREWPWVGDFPARLPSWVGKRTARVIAERPESATGPEVVFVHFALPDTMGHWFEWETPIQKLAVRWVDYEIGRITRALDETRKPGTWALILTADHGGHDGGHGQTLDGNALEDPKRDLSIPWIVVGANVPVDVSNVKVYDTAPTAAALLGLEAPASWKWQGQSRLAEDAIKKRSAQN